jgi:uncharacterized membrane protein YozB (DUF420 family)
VVPEFLEVLRLEVVVAAVLAMLLIMAATEPMQDAVLAAAVVVQRVILGTVVRVLGLSAVRRGQIPVHGTVILQALAAIMIRVALILAAVVVDSLSAVSKGQDLKALLF